MNENQLKCMFSKKTDNWKTPTKIYNHFIHDKNCLDPFPYKCNEDNMNKSYDAERERDIFINPPFSKLKQIPNFIERNLKGRTIYLLIPARTDTKYFHKLLDLKPQIYFIQKRLKYNDCGTSAPFPSILMVFKENHLLMQYMTISQEKLETL